MNLEKFDLYVFGFSEFGGVESLEVISTWDERADNREHVVVIHKGPFIEN